MVFNPIFIALPPPGMAILSVPRPYPRAPSFANERAYDKRINQR